jgi:flagellar motor component MotA
MNWSGILGLVFAALLLGTAALMGGSPGYFWSTSTMCLSVGIPLALAIATFGVRDCTRLGPLLRVLLVKMDPEDIRPRDVAMVRALIPYTYAAGVIAMLLGSIYMLVSMDDPARIGEGMAVSMLAPLYSLLIAELWLRPSLRQLEHVAPEAAPQADASLDVPQSILADLAGPVATLALVMFVLLQFFLLLLSFSTIA